MPLASTRRAEQSDRARNSKMPMQAQVQRAQRRQQQQRQQAAQVQRATEQRDRQQQQRQQARVQRAQQNQQRAQQQRPAVPRYHACKTSKTRNSSVCNARNSNPVQPKDPRNQLNAGTNYLISFLIKKPACIHAGFFIKYLVPRLQKIKHNFLPNVDMNIIISVHYDCHIIKFIIN